MRRSHQRNEPSWIHHDASFPSITFSSPSQHQFSTTTYKPLFNSRLPSNLTMDFAPYQDTSPETHRALSPPPAAGRRSTSFTPPSRSPAPQSPDQGPPAGANPWHQPAAAANNARGFGSDTANIEAGRGGRLDEFATSLPMRLDYEACLAYLLLPPAGGVFLLVVERKSDYVRYIDRVPLVAWDQRPFWRL